MKHPRHRQFPLLPFSLIAIIALVWVLSSVAERGMYVRPGTEAKAGEHKWGVVIGVNQYIDPVITDLKYAVADAQSIYDLLTDSQYGGFEAEKVRLLADESNTEPTRENVLIALTGIEKVADEDDTVFIFFSGHGIEESGVSYFLPSDANTAILRDTGIPMERFMDTLNRTKAEVQVMFFDACHSGVRGDKAMSGRLSNGQFSRIFAEAEGRAILSACDSDEVSWEHQEEGHGVFTYYLMQALKGNADVNSDSFVTVSEASNYVTENVKEWAFRNGRKQNPRLTYNVSGEIVLTLSSETTTGKKPSQSSFSIDDLEEETRRAEANKAAWISRLNEMKEAFDQVKGFQEQDVPADRKVTAWERFLEGFTEDNPYSAEDNQMRQEASQRVSYWKGEAERPDGTEPATGLPTTRIGKDGAEMVLIPAGDFQMGSNDGEDAGKPVHTVYLDAFYMDKYEVTNILYKRFMDATGHRAPKYWSDSRYKSPDQPVVGVSWHDAKAYAEWAGKRLPTEAEWEKAARGGLVGKKFPWGNEDLDGTQCNFADWSDKDANDGYERAAPVGSYPPNGYGLYDMAGNVSEWCADWYDEDYYEISPRENPMGPSTGEKRVLRGGSWDYHPYDISVADRYGNEPTSRDISDGFRCAGNVTP